MMRALRWVVRSWLGPTVPRPRHVAVTRSDDGSWAYFYELPGPFLRPSLSVARVDGTLDVPEGTAAPAALDAFEQQVAEAQGLAATITWTPHGENRFSGTITGWRATR